MSNAVRAGALYAVRNAASGHVGIVLGASDIITSVYANHLRPGTDEFVLSAGHGSAMLYSVLKLAGYNIQPLKTFRKLGGLSGHPELGTNGVNVTTGPLGQGIANAVGMALAKKMQTARRVKNSDGLIYCLCSDGDLMEGVALEAIAFAGHYELNNLVLLWDDNGVSIDGAAIMEHDIVGHVQAAGWNVLKVNGGNFAELDRALTRAARSPAPTFIQCKTVIGAGSSVAGTNAAHAFGLSNEELLKLEEKFTSATGLQLWDKVASRGIPARRKPQSGWSELPWLDFKVAGDNISTRELSGKYLEILLAKNSNIIGGSADLSASTNARVKVHRDIMPGDFSGNFINYGVREHAMAAIMNGMATCGFRPYGATFLVFSDYMRPAVRLAAFSKIPTIFVFSHDSVAVGEDGPTHQPIEQIASLRMVPNLNVFRPCNSMEVAGVWEMALAENDRPSCIILSRQKFKQIPTLSITSITNGAYVIYDVPNPKITIIATGSEVPLAVEVAKKLKNAAVVSMMSVERFRARTAKYKNKVLRGHIVALEAGATSGWFEFADAVVGIDSFGESGPGDEVYRHMGFDADAIAREISREIK